MEFLKKKQTTKSQGDVAEEAALAYLQDQGLRLLCLASEQVDKVQWPMVNIFCPSQQENG
jgi:hypothetical protein